MIRVLVVEDSPVVRSLLVAMLDADADIEVVGTAANGEVAVAQARRLRPDLVTMDIRMPKMDGLEAIRRIMEECPTPIVVISASVDAPDLAISFNAIKLGALEVVEKPRGLTHPDFESIRERLITSVKLMSEVKVIRRHPLRRRIHNPSASSSTEFEESEAELLRAGQTPGRPQPRRIQLVAIGASTGGPAALNTILQTLPADLPVPVLVVQHMTAGFTRGLATWLQRECALPIRIAAEHQRLRAGEIYLAADNQQHLETVTRTTSRLIPAPPVHSVRPSATVLFQSVARVFGTEALGVLLTGMGSDGAIGLKAMHDRGAPTIAQDEATSVVFGMPAEAIKLGAADHVLPIQEIGPTVVRILRAGERRDA